MPGFERLADFEPHTAPGNLAAKRKTKIEVRGEPLRVEWITGNLEVFHDLVEILLHKMREHEPVVQFGAPTNKFLLVRLLPETREERAQQQLLRETHPRMRGHFESAQLHQSEPATAAVGRIKFVDAELGPVGVAS